MTSAIYVFASVNSFLLFLGPTSVEAFATPGNTLPARQDAINKLRTVFFHINDSP